MARSTVARRICAIGVFSFTAGCFPSFPEDCFELGCEVGFACKAGGVCVPEDGGGGGSGLLSVEPAPHVVEGDPSVLRATFGERMRAADAERFVVRSRVDGRLTGTYGGGGTTELTFTPRDAVTAGTRVEVTLRSILQTVEGAALVEPFVYRFRTGGAPAGAMTTRVDEVEGRFTAVRSLRFVNLDDDPELEAVVGAGPVLDAIRVADVDATGRIRLRTDPLASGTMGVLDLEVGDVDGDGIRDIVVASGGSSRSRPYLGDGRGGYQPGAVFSVGGPLFRLRLGDLDGDGDLDFAATFEPNAQRDGRNVIVGRGNGNGSFVIAQPIDSTAGDAHARELELADMDRDGDLDIVVLNDDVTRSNGSVVTLYNDGRAEFGDANPAQAAEVGLVNVSLVAADFDGDGDVDAAVGSTFGSNVTVLRNDGSGRLGQPSSVAAGGPEDLAVGDVDGDGDLDLVTGGGALLENAAGNGELTAGRTFGGGGLVGLSDFDGDGDLDGVFVGRSGSTAFVTYRND